jgi:hydroxymethylpyrimidine pyrophosphatase-like HAD family hydrolase
VKIEPGGQKVARSNRKSLYGNPIEEVDAVAVPNNKVRKNPQSTQVGKTAKKTTQQTPVTGKSAYPSYGQSLPKFAPISDEVTVYGAKKFRAPFRANEFTGFKGSRPTAFILDIDGTITDHGQGLNKKTLEWSKKHIDKGEIAVVITARGPGMFLSSFNYLMHTLPFPFVGPFMREDDDPRYASEFKRELAEDLSKVYEFTGAADDNEWVIKMWQQWAIDHFEDPKDFDVLECGFTSYGQWRNDLPSKTGKTYDYTKKYDDHWDSDLKKYVPNVKDGKRWVPAKWVAEEKKTIAAHWEDIPVAELNAAKNRKAGDNTYPTWAKDPTDGKYKKTSEFISDPLPEEFGRSLQNTEAWKDYFAKRSESGAYDSPDWTMGLDAILDAENQELEEEESSGYSLYRNDLLQLVRHEYPGYSDNELESMDIVELRELAGIVGQNRHQGWDSLFTDEQLGIAGDISDEERNEKINNRMLLEEEVYAEYLGLTTTDIETSDLEDLDLLMLAAPYLDPSVKENLLDVGDALELAGNISKYVDQVEERDTLDEVVDIIDGEVADTLTRQEVLGEQDPKTGPLDVAEVLSEMNENDLPPTGAQAGETKYHAPLQIETDQHVKDFA